MTHFKRFPTHKLHCLALALAGLAWALAFAPEAHACGIGICNNDYPMFSPFMGTPYMPAMQMPMYQNYGYYQTGQMYQPYYPSPMDPMYVANVLNWNGAQPLGLTYGAPIGGSAIFNDAIYSSMIAR